MKHGLIRRKPSSELMCFIRIITTRCRLLWRQLFKCAASRENLSVMFQTISDTKQTVQALKLVRGLLEILDLGSTEIVLSV